MLCLCCLDYKYNNVSIYERIFFSDSLRYHLKDAIVGKIYFLLVRIKIKHMELAIIKRETTGTGMCGFLRCYWVKIMSIHPFYLFVLPFAWCSFIHLFINRFILSFIHLFNQSLPHSLIHSSNHTFIHSFIHLFIHSFIHSFASNSFHSLIFILIGPNTYNENETIAKYEIMDGAPVRGKISSLYMISTIYQLLTKHTSNNNNY